jgi:hypothetical protein
MELAFWLAMIFAGLPGIIAIPSPQYVLGMIMLALYYWYYSLSCYMSQSPGPNYVTARRAH